MRNLGKGFGGLDPVLFVVPSLFKKGISLIWRCDSKNFPGVSLPLPLIPFSAVIRNIYQELLRICKTIFKDRIFLENV